MDVSIIMPAYNAAPYISQALDSIISQHFDGSSEFLIADDNSTDDTRSIILSYQEKYPKIIKARFNDYNYGNPSDNYIQLAKSATGKYLAFCDSDDVWIDTHKLEKQFLYMEQHPECGMLCSSAIVIHGNQSVQFISPSLTQNNTLEKITLEKLIRQHSDVFNSSIILRRDLYLKMLDNCKWYVDNKCFFDTIWAWYFARWSELHFCPEPLIAYRSLDESDSHSKDKNKALMLDRRYYMMKLQFLLSQEISIDIKMVTLMEEYDKLYRNAIYDGVIEVHKSKAYKIGKMLLKPIKRLTVLFN